MTAAGNPEPKPELAVNRDGSTVAEAVNGFVSHASTAFKEGANLDIATAYFNLGGYSQLADSLDLTTHVRLLLGAEPTPPEQRPRKLGQESIQPKRAAADRLGSALNQLQGNLVDERNLLGFTVDADHSARRLVGWLRSGQVEVRRLESRFLHGKAFLIGTGSHGVVAGSSNFTHAGLTTNEELNLGAYSPHTVAQVQEWFNDLWDDAVPYDLAELFDARFVPHSPYLIFLRMLWEMYGHELEEQRQAEGTDRIHLAQFQQDGLWRAGEILKKYNGVLIADEVGLGKTFMAGHLIDQAANQNRQRVLVVTPASLRDGPWRAFKANHNLNMELVSYDQLAADPRLNPVARDSKFNLDAEPNQYSLVVVDEAHNLRSPTTQRATALRNLLAGSPAKNLVLLTATPVNNSLWDLYWLLNYFLPNDGVFANVGIGSLRKRFGEAMELNPRDLSPKYLFDVLDTVAVRRTRSFVKNHYANDTVPIDGEDQPITFPTPRVRRVDYDLDAVLPDVFNRLAAALDPDDSPGAPEPGAPEPGDSSGAPGSSSSFTLARYAPSQYRLDHNTETYEVQLAGLMRSGLLKRFESSPYAFAETCGRMAKSCYGFMSLLEQGKVATGRALADWVATDSDEIEEVDKYLDEHMELLDDASEYDIEALKADVASDAALFRAFEAEARTVTPEADPTLAALVEELAEIAAQAAAEGIGPSDTRDKAKVLVFSYFADTVEWVHEHLLQAVEADPRLAAYAGRVATVTGGDDDKAKVLWGFAPRTTEAPSHLAEDRYDILVTTDVLAEGVNLQQARHIINYDLPWNPMRLVQRHGRIDRIGSKHPEVFIRCVFPDSRLDDLLGLEERLHQKIAQAAATVGVGTVIPGQQEMAERVFTETREEIERLRREDNTLFEQGGTEMSTLSGEEYRQELRKAMGNEALASTVKGLAYGSGSGMASPHLSGSQRGFVFCLRVGDWSQPLFRYVAVDADTGQCGEVAEKTLDCLHLARPPDLDSTPRVLDERTQELAYAAWAEVVGHVTDGWNYFSDKANLEPQIPRVLRRVAEVLRDNPPAGLQQDELDSAIDSVLAPHTNNRVLSAFRAVIKHSADPAEQAQQSLEVINTLGLHPYSAPEPLPAVTPEDIRLICWQALTPA